MPKLEITSQERSALRAAAHPLRPVVLIGDKGLTTAVLKEIETHLDAHALIKVRVSGDDRDARSSMMESICETLSCAPVHHLGKTLIIYRPSEKAQPLPVPPSLETRAVRKPSEPHIPKKQAAQGARPDTRGAKSRARPAASDTPTGARSRRPSAATDPSARHGIPRRSGSALSLRAGARRRQRP